MKPPKKAKKSKNVNGSELGKKNRLSDKDAIAAMDQIAASMEHDRKKFDNMMQVMAGMVMAMYVHDCPKVTKDVLEKAVLNDDFDLALRARFSLIAYSIWNLAFEDGFDLENGFMNAPSKRFAQRIMN